MADAYSSNQSSLAMHVLALLFTALVLAADATIQVSVPKLILTSLSAVLAWTTDAGCCTSTSRHSNSIELGAPHLHTAAGGLGSFARSLVTSLHPFRSTLA